MTYDFQDWADENYGDDVHGTGLTLSVVESPDSVALVIKANNVPGLTFEAEFTLEPDTDLDAFITMIVRARDAQRARSPR